MTASEGETRPSPVNGVITQGLSATVEEAGLAPLDVIRHVDMYLSEVLPVGMMNDPRLVDMEINVLDVLVGPVDRDARDVAVDTHPDNENGAC